MKYKGNSVKYVLGWMLWALLFVALPSALIKVFYIWVILPSLLPVIVDYGDMGFFVGIALPMLILPISTVIIGWHVGLHITSRFMKREQMLEWLIGPNPKQWSTKASQKIVNCVYK